MYRLNGPSLAAVLSLGDGARGTGLTPGRRSDRPRGVVVTGVEGGRPEQLAVRVGAGRMLRADDTRPPRDVAVVSESLARRATGASGPAASSGAVGKTVRVGSRDFRIVGVLEPSAGDRSAASAS